MSSRISALPPSLRLAIELSLTFAIAAIFARSAVIHVRNPYYFLGSVLQYRLCDATTGQAVAMSLPFLQLVIASCLVLRIWVNAALSITVCLAGLFATVQASALVRDLNIGCGCFGAAGEHEIGWRSILGVVALGVVGGLALGIRSRGKQLTRPGEPPSPTSGRER